MSAVVAALVLVPLAAALLIALARRSSDRVADGIANAAAAIVFVLALFLVGPVLGGSTPAWFLGGSTALGISLRADALSLLLLLVVSAGSLAATVYSVPYMSSYTSKARYYVLFMLMLAGLNIVVLGADVVNMYVGIEVAAIACYALVAYGLGPDYLEASFKYQVLGTLGTLCLIGGIGLLYARVGDVSFGAMTAAQSAAGISVPAVLLMSGFALKAAFVPYHAWLPDAHSTAPSPVSAVLSGVFIKVVGLYGLMRLLFVAFAPGGGFATALLVLASLSIIIGAVLALVQGDMKRLLAYCTVSQMGYVLLGLAVGTPLAIAAALFHLVNHAAFKELFFLGAGTVERQAGTRDISALGGLNSRMPVTGATSAVAFLSVIGMPPFNGFWSKLLIIVAAVQAGQGGYAAVGAIGAILTIGYFLRYERGVFFGSLPHSLKDVKEGPALMLAPMVVLAAACIILGLAFPWFMQTFLEPAAQAILPGA
jgi:multicomponent Na+:H+ antiporter subunit D